jgi:hypothetical protein
MLENKRKDKMNKTDHALKILLLKRKEKESAIRNCDCATKTITNNRKLFVKELESIEAGIYKLNPKYDK